MNSNLYDFERAWNEQSSTEASIFHEAGSIFDLADAFLSIESMTHKKLQKLCFYAKAWYLALYGTELIKEPFEAWVHGAVQPELYQKYRVYGFGYIPQVTDTRKIPEEFLSFAREIFNSYGQLDGDELEKLNHSEPPWKKARGTLKPWQGSRNIISNKDMEEYYRSLL